MSCKHEWSEDCYDVVPSQVCGRCNAWRIEEDQEELIRDAYRRGAEAMREACARYIEGEDKMFADNGLRALPIPEDKP